MKEMKDYLPCWRRIGPIMNYCVDERSSEDHVIPHAIFFQEIYSPRNEADEVFIRDFLTTPEGVLFIQAPRGNGKTSFLRKALFDTESHNRIDLVFDCDKHKQLLYQIEALDLEPAIVDLHELMKRFVMNQLIGGHQKRIVDFVFAAINTECSSLKAPLVAQMTRNTDLRTDTINLREFLFHNMDIATEVMVKIQSEIGLGSMLRIIRKQLKNRSIVLILENVDRIKLDLQPHVIRFFLDAYRAGEGAFTVIVAIRNTNLAFSQASGAGKQHGVVLTIEYAEDENLFLEDCFQRRETYSVKKHLVSINHPCKDGFPHIYSSIQQLVNGQVVREGICNLANRSYSQTLLLKHRFGRYLFDLYLHEAIPERDGSIVLSEYDCSSFFFRWIYSIMNEDREWLRDPITNYWKFSKGRIADPIVCDLEIVLLSWLYVNREMQLRFSNVCDDFASIGVEHAPIRNTIYNLYELSNPNLRHVELGIGERKVELEDIGPATRIAITPLGSEFVHRLFLRYEFLAEALRHPRPIQRSSEAAIAGLPDDHDEMFEKVHKHLELMVTTHSRAFDLYRSKYSGSEDWENYYRSIFCIGGELIIERLMRSHLRHFRHISPDLYPVHREKYVELLKQYYSAIGSKRNADRSLRMNNAPS